MCDASIVQCARDVTFECSSIRVGCQRMRGRWNMNRHSDVHRMTTTTNDERRDRSIDRSMDERRSAKSRVSFIFFYSSVARARVIRARRSGRFQSIRDRFESIHDGRDRDRIAASIERHNAREIGVMDARKVRRSSTQSVKTKITPLVRSRFASVLRVACSHSRATSRECAISDDDGGTIVRGRRSSISMRSTSRETS